MWLYLFEAHPEFQHLPLAERREAARFAQKYAFRHWQTWLALLFLFLATGGLAALTIAFTNDVGGTSGALVGFALGSVSLHCAIYRLGLRYYRQALSRSAQVRGTRHDSDA